MAATFLLWQVWMSSLTYASMNGTVIVTSERSGRTYFLCIRVFLMYEKI